MWALSRVEQVIIKVTQAQDGKLRKKPGGHALNFPESRATEFKGQRILRCQQFKSNRLACRLPSRPGENPAPSWLNSGMGTGSGGGFPCVTGVVSSQQMRAHYRLVRLVRPPARSMGAYCSVSIQNRCHAPKLARVIFRSVCLSLAACCRSRLRFACRSNAECLRQERSP